MSGLIGFTHALTQTVGGAQPFADTRQQAQQTVRAMTDAIAHRGPDGFGMHVDEEMCLGARWLDTLTAGGTQPFYSEDRTKVLVYDGEIYNHEILREELIAAGHVFATHSDGEVVLHGFEQWGIDELLKRLRGKFAFVIWDVQAKVLWGARDFFGVKPLYYYTGAGDLSPFMFASEIKAFLHHPQFDKRLNEAVLANYLSFQYSVTHETFFQDVYKLPPAHYFTLQLDAGATGKRKPTPQMTQYQRPAFKPVAGSLEEYADRIDQAVEETVGLHTMAAPGVTVGSFLSSGVDSSYIASKSGVDKTFTVGFISELYNETDYAKEFARLIGVENYSKVITPHEYWEALGTIQYHMDEPLADPAAVGLYFASKLAGEHATVVLSGEGADELFGGYGVYREPLQKAALYRKMPAFVWRFVGAVARPLYTVAPTLPGRDFLMRRNKPLQQWFIGNADIFNVAERRALLKSNKDTPAPQQITAPYYAQTAHYDDVAKMQYLDIHLWSAGDILLKADRMTTAHSIEVRSPLLDREIMKLAESLPLECRVDTACTKKAFRLAAARSLPEVVANKDKLGFPVPLRVWLKEDAYYEQVKTAFTSEVAHQFFHTNALVRLLDDNRRCTDDAKSNVLSRKIWTVYMFLVWYDEFFVKR